VRSERWVLSESVESLEQRKKPNWTHRNYGPLHLTGAEALNHLSLLTNHFYYPLAPAPIGRPSTRWARTINGSTLETSMINAITINARSYLPVD